MSDNNFQVICGIVAAAWLFLQIFMAKNIGEVKLTILESNALIKEHVGRDEEIHTRFDERLDDHNRQLDKIERKLYP